MQRDQKQLLTDAPMYIWSEKLGEIRGTCLCLCVCFEISRKLSRFSKETPQRSNQQISCINTHLQDKIKKSKITQQNLFQKSSCQIIWFNCGNKWKNSSECRCAFKTVPLIPLGLSLFFLLFLSLPGIKMNKRTKMMSQFRNYKVTELYI